MSAAPKTWPLGLREYQEIGIETFITSAYPHLEEIFNVAELLFPALGLDGEAAPAERGWDFEFGRGVAPGVAASGASAAGRRMREAAMSYARIIGFSGNITRPSKTFALVDHVVQDIARATGLGGRTYDIEDLGLIAFPSQGQGAELRHEA